MVAAMGSMILAFSIGGVIGPYSASIVMGFFGNILRTLWIVLIVEPCDLLYLIMVSILTQSKFNSVLRNYLPSQSKYAW